MVFSVNFAFECRWDSIVQWLVLLSLDNCALGLRSMLVCDIVVSCGLFVCVEFVVGGTLVFLGGFVGLMVGKPVVERWLLRSRCVV